MSFYTGVLGMTLIMTNTFFWHHIPIFRGSFKSILETVCHITSTFWEPFNIFCEILYRRSWCSFWGSLHYFFFHIMTLLVSVRGIFGLTLGNVYLIIDNCSIFSHQTLYRCSWYNDDGHCTKKCFLYHVPRVHFRICSIFSLGVF